MSVKEEGELLACCMCLAADTELYDIQESELGDTFVALMGTEVRWCGRELLCSWCRAGLARAAGLRARGRRAQALLANALQQTHTVTIDYIRTIDRLAEKLCLNLKTCHVYSSDSTVPDVKLEDIKEETDDFTENIFVSEPAIDDENYIQNTPGIIENDNVDQSNIKFNSNGSNCTEKSTKLRNNKRKLPLSIKETRRKLPRSTKVTKKLSASTKETKKLPEITKKPPESTGKTKRIIKRRMADNGFLPDFNFDEFQSKYNVRIDILSKEEQLREIEARKMAPGFALAAFGCERCGKGFASQQVYDAHVMKHDVRAGAHACGVCGLRFASRSRALVHGDAHRLRFTCRACGFLTRTRFIAKNHFLSHAGATHQCPHCDAAFNKYTSYLTHVRRRHPAMNVACDECGETFVGANGLRHHKTRVHRNRMMAEQSPAGDACDQNGKPRPRAPAEQRRARTCKECEQTFVDARSLDTHRARVHLGVRAREPPRARARPARAFICELCGHECSSVSVLAAHARAHAGCRPHACPAPGCARAFATPHNMRRHHSVVHLGQRPSVSCGVCGKQLAHAASLKLHVNTVHLKLPAPPRRRRPDT